jgi:hypothetical protein
VVVAASRMQAVAVIRIVSSRTSRRLRSMGAMVRRARVAIEQESRSQCRIRPVVSASGRQER